MDAVVKGKRRKAAAAAAAANGAQRRPPLVPSEKNNAAAAPAGRRREVPSRFKPVAPPAAAPAPAAPAGRRCASPSPGRAPAADGSATCNRARSAERARPAAPSAAPSSRPKPSSPAAARSSSPARDAAIEAHGHGAPPRARNAKASNGLWASARSSSPSVRPESVPAAGPAKKIDRLVHGLPSEQTKLRSGAAAERKKSPLRGRTNNISDQCENARSPESAANRATERHRWPGMMTGRGSAGLTSTSAAPAERTSRSVSSPNASSGCSPRRLHPSEETGKSLKRPSKEMPMIVHRRRNDNADSSSDTSSQTSESCESTCHPSKAISSPVPVLHRSSSPRQGLSAAPSTSRSCQSPSRTRPSTPCRSKCAPSAAQSGAEQPVFNYIVDARKGKKNAGQIENVHQLRLLNNRYLQWRFVNAHSEDTVLPQKNGVENILYSVLESTLTLRDALTITKINVQRLQQELNLYNILTEQIGYLEQWPVLEEESTGTVVEAMEALQAATLCLPVISGAQADGVAVRNAISSAVDVMQALSSSMFYLQSKVQDRTSLVSELLVMARQEKVALDQCKELLATAAKLQVQETSLRTHLMQLREGSAG
ncbi:hypothetical protein GQ55_6G207900 [Panicum hallii var. hallii]|uniref:Uncharacterized protein n=1 Tax=Panicum hallii var. hallii TaxID=1504633 RepID=A0A2T7D7Y0_9POAL|nr:hypothetical protein GQ55_6G207900 [Panicum hallii var. hallii]